MFTNSMSCRLMAVPYHGGRRAPLAHQPQLLCLCVCVIMYTSITRAAWGRHSTGVSLGTVTDLRRQDYVEQRASGVR